MTTSVQGFQGNITNLESVESSAAGVKVSLAILLALRLSSLR